MTFNEVIGQDNIKARLKKMVRTEQVPHALLFCGTAGCGKLPMALATASALLCKNQQNGSPCGACPACAMTAKLAHPDLHFSFPVIKKEGQTSAVISDQFLAEWRAQILETPYFTNAQWQERMKVKNQQMQITKYESDLLQQKLSIVSSQGGYKVVIIYMAEYMNEVAANKLLKLLEEPPAKTVFILTANEPEKMLTTILSRTNRIDFPPLKETEIAAELVRKHGLDEENARLVARFSEGSFTRALQELQVSTDRQEFFDMFVLLMRLGYARKVKDLRRWAETVAMWGREKQKNFLSYCQRLVRENFVRNFHHDELNYMTKQEADFSVRFSPFINERNIIGIYEELSLAERDIAANVNANMVFFDFSLKMIVLLIQ